MNETQFESAQKPVEPAQPTGIARRRLLRAGLAAAPVVLTLSGRSAMAATCPSGLSPAAWTSLAPNGTCATTSHTVNGNALGKSPGYWMPNPEGKTFQEPYKWPVTPFSQVTMHLSTGDVVVGWDATKGYNFYEKIDHSDTGYDGGTKFNSVFGGPDKSFSRILIEGNVGLEWHVTAAYLNYLVMGGAYALTLDELKRIYSEGRLVPGGTVLGHGELKAFLDQTWTPPPPLP
ncbi:MAG: hypothetical protein ACOYNF_04020 [Rhodoferax sp.]